MAKLYIVGSGPGDISHLTETAREAIASASTIVGYNSYIDLIRPLVDGKRVIATAMMQEVDRCREAISLAREGDAQAIVDLLDDVVPCAVIRKTPPAANIEIIDG